MWHNSDLLAKGCTTAAFGVMLNVRSDRFGYNRIRAAGRQSPPRAPDGYISLQEIGEHRKLTFFVRFFSNSEKPV